MPGVWLARSLACNKESTQASHRRFAENVPAFPARWFYGFLRDLLGEPGFLPPSSARCVSIVANLISASGYRDHTTSPSEKRRARQPHRPRPSHPAPNVRDDRETPPSASAGRESDIADFTCPSSKTSENQKLVGRWRKPGIAGTAGAL
jgi:hypothetical protein